MYSRSWKLLPAFALLPLTAPAFAASVQVSGKIIVTQGHETPSCRMVQLKRLDNGNMIWFRIPDTGTDNSIMAVTLTAVATGLSVTVTYDPVLTSGCGAEPKILYISLLAP